MKNRTGFSVSNFCVHFGMSNYFDILLLNPGLDLLAQIIFQFLDDTDLNQARLVSKTWKNYIDQRHFYPKRILRKISFARAFHFSAKVGHLPLLRHLLKMEQNYQDSDGNSPIHTAAKVGHLEALKCFPAEVQASNLPNQSGFTPLHYASENGHLLVVKYLLKVIQGESQIFVLSNFQFF